MKYRLGIDMGPTSIGAAIIALDENNKPKAICRTAVAIFNSGLTAKTGASLAVNRREKRAARRNNDRYLKRRSRLTRKLIEYGFFPQEQEKREALVTLNPYALRAEGLDRQLTPSEFARAVFHMNQRRGFQSNRKADKKDDDSKKMATAIRFTNQSIQDGNFRTVGEWLRSREKQGLPLRARPSVDNKTYDLYINRDMVKHEFNELWNAQSKWNPKLFNQTARDDLFDTLFFQRNLRPGNVGRCTLDTKEHRAPKALPSVQLFRILQELNHLRIETEDYERRQLTLQERDILMNALNEASHLTFGNVRKLLGLGRSVAISHDNERQEKLKGNTTNSTLSQADKFGSSWSKMTLAEQDEVVEKILGEKNEDDLIKWLQSKGLSAEAAQNISQAGLAEGYGMLSKKTINKLLPEMIKKVVTYNVAVVNAGFASHSDLDVSATGEIMKELPYYGEVLVRHVSFQEETKVSIAADEAKFGKIGNPNVHIALNQLRKLVNAVLKKYGHPQSIVIEVARELKQSLAARSEMSKAQKKNEAHNEAIRNSIAEMMGTAAHTVSKADVEKMKLWEELKKAGNGVAHCPYSGVVISQRMALSSEVEVDHILPFADTLDDSMMNKTLCMRQANRKKGKRAPWEARDDFASQGWEYKDILERVKKLPQPKALRFLPNAMQDWLKDSSDFLARHLNDTRYIAKLTREYVSVICPQATWVVTGKHTSLIRGKLGLNKILSSDGKKNREDHRHHAIDACVIGITDRDLLKKISTANALELDLGSNRLVGEITPPFPAFRAHVKLAIENCVVHHKQDHSHTGAIMDDSAYSPTNKEKNRKNKKGKEQAATPIHIAGKNTSSRHGINPDGSPKAYKVYESGSNYCVEIVQGEDEEWVYEFLTSYEAHQVVRKCGKDQLRNKHFGQSGKPLVMRLMIDDMLQIKHKGVDRKVRVVKMDAGKSKEIYLIDHNESNVAKRVADKTLSYIKKSATALQKSCVKQISVSYLGGVKTQKEFSDPKKCKENRK